MIAPPRTALIVGISGQDGSYLSQFLLDRGYDVVGTSRDASASRLANLSRLAVLSRVRVESMNTCDSDSVLQVLSKYEPDEIYNVAGPSSVAMSFQRPIETLNGILTGTATLLEAIRSLGKPTRFYNAGSSECFGDVSVGVANELTPFRPRSPYAAAKAAAHWMVSNYRDGYGIFACNGILFNHESPLRPEHFVTRKIAIAAARISRGEQQKLVLGDTKVKRDWGWAPEYVEAMWRMLQQETAEDLVIATGRLSTLEDFVAAAFDEAGLDWRRHVESDASLMRPTDLRGFAGDSSRAHEKLGWRAASFMDIVARKMVREELDVRA